MPSSPSWRMTAEPLASTATQPRLPHVHMHVGLPDARGCGRCRRRGRGCRAAARRSAMIPAPIPVATLTKTMCARSRQWQPVLAQRHRVDVALEQRGRAEALGQHVGDRVAVPARHDRRVGRPPATSTGPGTPTADRQHVVAAAPGLAPAARRTCARPSPARPPARRRCRSAPRARPARRPRGRRPPAGRGARRGRRPARRRRASLKASAAGRRPPLDGPASGCSTSRPADEQHAEPLHDRRAREARSRP